MLDDIYSGNFKSPLLIPYDSSEFLVNLRFEDNNLNIDSLIPGINFSGDNLELYIDDPNFLKYIFESIHLFTQGDNWKIKYENIKSGNELKTPNEIENLFKPIDVNSCKTKKIKKLHYKLSGIDISKLNIYNVTADGNCLVRAVSLSLFGTEDHHLLLRNLMVYELIVHWPFYIQITSEMKNYFDINSSESSKSKWEHILLNAAKKDEYLELVHLFILSNATGRVFVLYGNPEEMIYNQNCATVFPFRRRNERFSQQFNVTA